MNNFEDITGNEFIINGLQKSIKEGKTAHAYIFDGKPGSGKKLLAGAFAKTLQCEKGGIKPCGECVSCRAFDDSNHTDVIYVSSDKLSIGVDLVREQINNLVKIKPYKYRYKIFIVDKASSMTVQAQNALLKNIEEPPSYVKFLFLTDNSALFLPTVLSRCVLYKILPLKFENVYNYLSDKGYDKDLLNTVCALSEGSIGKAFELLNDEAYIALRNDVLEIIGKFDKYAVPDILLLTKELEKFKDKPDSFLDIMYLWYRDAAVYKSTKSEERLIQTDKSRNIARFCENTSLSNIINGINAVFDAKTALKYNANFRLAMDVMLLKIAGA